MDDQPTCGKGLAEHSTLPAKLGELIDALAENLEVRALLQEWVERDGKMLAGMSGHPGPR